MFKQIYISGCSHTVGGGLDLTPVRDFYEQRGVSYKDTRKMSYTNILNNEFSLPLIDDSMSGTGAIRLIRETHKFIERIGVEEAQKTLFIFQINESPFRVSQWSNGIEDYCTLFIEYDEENRPHGHMLDIWVGHKKWTPLEHGANFEITTPFLKYMYNPVEYAKEIKIALIGFLSYLVLNKFNFIFTCEDLEKGALGEQFEEYRFFPDGHNSLYKYAEANKILLRDMIEIKDNHASIQAHQEYAKLLIQHIKQKYGDI